jgi:hypothetical protein
MKVITWIIRGILGLVALAALGFGGLLIWPQLVVPEWNPRIGTGVPLGMSYADLARRWGPSPQCEAATSREPTLCVWMQYTRRLTWQGFKSDIIFHSVDFVNGFVTAVRSRPASAGWGEGK